jgi:hypothetical protein
LIIGVAGADTELGRCDVTDKKVVIFWSVVASVLITGALVFAEVRAARAERKPGYQNAGAPTSPGQECAEIRFEAYRAEFDRRSGESPKRGDARSVKRESDSW